jgi:toxin FitB
LSFLLDTNALSEPQKPRPDISYMAWVNEQPPLHFYTSVLSMGEVRHGALSLPPGARRAAIEAWLERAMTVFGSRILAVDVRVAEAWSAVMRTHRLKGLTISAVDELIAATALVHDLTVVTRNVRHFEASGCKLLSPWTES